MRSNHQQRMAIAESCYGREFGWVVESPTGEALAELAECRSEDMFWDSYLVIPSKNHPETVTPEFWHPACHQFRNRRFTDHIVESFGHFDPSSGRVTLRSLYIDINPTLFDKCRAPIRYIRILRRMDKAR
jgi:hypothetical protein